MFRMSTQNIPIECIRTLVTIAEAGSLSKAAERLGLSQPAISAQVKRIQTLVGGELFIKTANGTSLTELGQLALQQARRILDANDQILHLGGDAKQMLCRVGITSVFANQLFESLESEVRSRIFIHADHSILIRKGIIEGYIDVGCMFSPNAYQPQIEDAIVEEHPMTMTWVKSRKFALSPGAPLPIITLPEDDWMIGPLQRKGSPYRIVLKSADHSIRVAAVRASIGLTAMPESVVPPDLVKASDYYLPALAQHRALICVRRGIDSLGAMEIARKVSAALFPTHGVQVERGLSDRQRRRAP
ncbi:MAG: LysR family transcriptional regulator [Bradyrhizobium sp.]